MSKSLLMILQRTYKRIDFIAFLPPILFLILLLPLLTVKTCSDASYDYSNAQEVFRHGLQLSSPSDSLRTTYPLHPPLKYLLTSGFFRLGGVNQLSFNLMGILLGIVGIVSMYGLGKQISNRSVGIISALLLSISPLYLSNAIHSLTDFQVAVYVLTALYFYARSKLLWYALFTSAAVLTKETALILPIAVLVTEILYLVYRKPAHASLLHYFRLIIVFTTPLIFYYLWFLYIKQQGGSEWSAFIFAETKNLGAFATVINNILTLKLFNSYASQHIQWFLYLNFNWVYWLMAILGLLTVWQHPKQWGKAFISDQHKATVAISLFFLGYVITVLTFQTYAIPRYHLPVLAFLYIPAAIFLFRVVKKYAIIVAIFISILAFASLYYSIDPISRTLWGGKFLFGQIFYDVTDDDMRYNLQFPRLIKERTAYGVTENI